MITVLAGGVGAAKFLQGLVEVVDPQEVTIIGNTGDDIDLHGLHISPDLDIVTYTLAGISHAEQGWGIQGDTFHTLEMLGRYGHPTWFNLGDYDLATHLHRTERLRHGWPLSAITDEIRQALGVVPRILPMTDQRADQLLALEQALEKLTAEAPQKADLVRLRYFAGLSHQEAAQALGISRATADRHWAYAKSFLRCELDDHESL